MRKKISKKNENNSKSTRIKIDDAKKYEILKKYFKDKISIPKLAKEYKINPVTIYSWRIRYIELKNKFDIKEEINKKEINIEEDIDRKEELKNMPISIDFKRYRDDMIEEIKQDIKTLYFRIMLIEKIQL